jgi:hypothetical protein
MNGDHAISLEVVMNIRLCLILIFCAVVSSAQTTSRTSQPAIDTVHMPPANLTPFEQQLLNTEKTLLDAIERGDTSYVSAAVADNFVVITANGDPSGKGEVLERAAPPTDRKTRPQPLFYDFKVVPLAENAAVVTYNVVFPTHIERYQHLSDTWIREGTQWKLKFRQTTLNLWSAHDL